MLSNIVLHLGRFLMRSIKLDRYYSRTGSNQYKGVVIFKHHEKGKDHVMIVLYVDMDVEGDEAVKPESEPKLNRMDQRVQNLFKFKQFYDQMDFNSNQRLAITKVIIELTGSSGGSGLAQRVLYGGN